MASARDLTAHLADLLRRERGAMAEFLLALADFDERRRWVELGYSSLFDFLRRELGLSKSAAFQRMTAAALIRRHSEVVEPLRDGRLCLSSSRRSSPPRTGTRCWPGSSTCPGARRWR